MEDASAAVAHQIRVTVDDDLRRSRLTVFFRLLLAFVHLFWLLFWTPAAFVAAFLNWLATLVTGLPPALLYRFLTAYVRYVTQVLAYLTLAANPFPGFVGEPRSYPIDVEFGERERQNRLTVLFRPILAIPAFLFANTFFTLNPYAPDLTSVTSFLGWFASLARGRMPEGIRDAEVYALRYSAQAWAYAFVLTGRYPNADPALERDAPAREHPVELRLDDDLRRSRLTVFFRLLLALPHFVWLTLWWVAALFAAIAAWFAAIVTGVVPAPLHRFLAAFVRYSVHVAAFVSLVANPFPGFTGRRYVVDVTLPEPERQNRATVAFRPLLAIPVFLLQGSIAFVMYMAAFLGWFASLVLGRMPLGLRNAAAWGVRYSAQGYAYLYLLTGRYPFSGPPA